MPICKHCHKYFKKGNGKGSLKTHCAAVKAAAKKRKKTLAVRKSLRKVKKSLK